METRTLIVKFDSGEVKRVTIPVNWTVTFSGFIPKMNDKGYGISRPSLRVYGPRKVQMACFTNVDSFRDSRVQVLGLDKSELDDLYWRPQEDLDNAPVVMKNGDVMKIKEVSSAF